MQVASPRGAHPWAARFWGGFAALIALLTLVGCATVISGQATPATTLTSESPRPTIGNPSVTATPSSSAPTGSEPTGAETTMSAPSRTSTSTPPSMPTAVDVDKYLDAVTDSLLALDRAAFLSFFVGAANEKAAFWWDNMAAIGMDGGAVSAPANGDRLDIDAAGNGQLSEVYLGSHFPGDGTDETGKMKVSTSAYDWNVHVVLNEDYEPTGIQITEWRSISRAPWDCDCALHVARGDSGVVAALPAEAGLADEMIRYQDTANTWLAGFLALSGSQVAMTTQVVSFVTFNDSLLYSWFNPESAGNGEVIEGGFAAAVQSSFSYYGTHPAIAANVPGTEPRMVIGNGVMTFDEPVELLVHELVHYHWEKYSTDDYYASYEPYIPEGMAQMVEQVYYFTDDASASIGNWVVGTPDQMWSTSSDQIATMFTDQLPTPAQLRDSNAEEINFWYDIAASTYSYIAVNYGMTAAVQTSVCAYREGTVFGCVSDPADPSKRLDEATLTTGWAAWVRSSFG